jgi:ribonuclease Z
MYHENIHVVEHPVREQGIVHEDETFRIEAYRLEHGVDNWAYRVSEQDTRKFDPQKLKDHGVQGPLVRELAAAGFLIVNEKKVVLDDVSHVRKGDVFAIVIDTLPCPGALVAAQGASLLLCESTYLKEHEHLAHEYHHMTAEEAALIAKKAGVKLLVLTHFSARYQQLDGFEKEARAIFPQTVVAEDLKVIQFPKSS